MGFDELRRMQGRALGQSEQSVALESLGAGKTSVKPKIKKKPAIKKPMPGAKMGMPAPKKLPFETLK